MADRLWIIPVGTLVRFRYRARSVKAWPENYPLQGRTGIVQWMPPPAAAKKNHLVDVAGVGLVNVPVGQLVVMAEARMGRRPVPIEPELGPVQGKLL